MDRSCLFTACRAFAEAHSYRELADLLIMNAGVKTASAVPEDRIGEVVAAIRSAGVVVPPQEFNEFDDEDDEDDADEDADAGEISFDELHRRAWSKFNGAR